MPTKWFEEGLDEEALTKAYRKLAKQYHPDVNHDEDAEDKFKEFSFEYSRRLTLLQRAKEPTQFISAEDLQDALASRTQTAYKVVSEVYPRTDIGWSVGYSQVFLEFRASTPLTKMVHIVNMVQETMGPTIQVIVEFRRDGTKKSRNLTVAGNCIYVDCMEEDVPKLGNWTITTKGRRYLQYTQAKWQYIHDTKGDIHYFMRKLPKLSLQELLGL